MKKFFAMIAAVALAGFGCGGQKEKTPEATNNGSAQSGNPLTAPVDYVGAVVKSKNTAQKTVDTANLTRAIQMFQATEGRYPKDLQELVNQRYLPSLPAAAPGTRWVYDPANGQVKLVRQ